MAAPASVGRPSLRARFNRFFARRLRYQIVLPYLLLAAVFAAGGTYLFMSRAAEEQRNAFNTQLVSAVRRGGVSLASLEDQQITGLRYMLFTEGVVEAIQNKDQTQLRALLAGAAINNKFDRVLVVDGSGQLLLDWRPSAPAQAATAPVATDSGLQALIRTALQPEGERDKVSALVDSGAGPLFYTAGALRQRPTGVVGAILAGSALPTVLDKVAQDSQSALVTLYGADGQAVGHIITGTLTVPAMPALPGGWADAIRARPTDPAPFRTLILGGETFVEALGAVPAPPGLAPPAVYGVALSARARDIDLLSNLWTLVIFIGVGLLLIIWIGNLLAEQIDHPVGQLVAASEQVAQGNLEVQVPVRRRDELGTLTERFNEMVVGLRQLLFVKDLFGRFVSPEVSEQLLDGRIELGGERRTVTILFSDLRDFTYLAEQHPPEVIVDLLNEYFRQVIQAAQTHGGIVNKFGGDSTLIIFGAPVPTPDHADRALATALDMRAALEEVNAHRTQEGWQPLRQGIGITTGQVVAGQIGSESRMEYTVIGDPVNIAARLQELIKNRPGVDIVFSENTLAALADVLAWSWDELGELEVRGRQQPVQVYTLVGRGPGVAAVAGAALARDEAVEGVPSALLGQVS
jgi:adenylate cyclase